MPNFRWWTLKMEAQRVSLFVDRILNILLHVLWRYRGRCFICWKRIFGKACNKDDDVMVLSSANVSSRIKESANFLYSFCLIFISYQIIQKVKGIKQLCIAVLCLHFFKPTFIPNLFHALWLWKRIVYKMKNDEIIVVNLFLVCFNVKKFLEKIEKLSKREK